MTAIRGNTTMRWKNQRKYEDTPPYHNWGHCIGFSTDIKTITVITITNRECTNPPMKSPSNLVWKLRMMKKVQTMTQNATETVAVESWYLTWEFLSSVSPVPVLLSRYWRAGETDPALLSVDMAPQCSMLHSNVPSQFTYRTREPRREWRSPIWSHCKHVAALLRGNRWLSVSRSRGISTAGLKHGK